MLNDERLYRAQARVITVLNMALKSVREQYAVLLKQQRDLQARCQFLEYDQQERTERIVKLECQLEAERAMHGITKEERNAARQALASEQDALEGEIATLQQQLEELQRKTILRW